MVRLAQDFSMRYPLVDGQGNFGSIDGDAAAAMRYTEARMSQVGFDLLEDIDKETVDFDANFDDSMEEPSVLPATLPNLLVNGSSGIAVGMATSIPPHNLGEVVDALTFMLDRWEEAESITIADLMRFIQGPDFPTGGLVFRQRGDTDALVNAYSTGRGRCVVRAKVHVEHMGRNKSRIIVSELPYQTNKTNLLSRIADLHREGRLEGLTDLRDESDRNGMRIIIETTRTVEPEAVLAELFKQTPMQATFSIIMVALVNGEPRVLNLKQALRVYLEHRLEIVRRRSEYNLKKAQARAHILEGLLKALDHLDAIIDMIRRSKTADTAKTNLQREFKLSEIQAQAVLDMQLRRLAALERRKIQDEHKETIALIEELQTLLAKPQMIRRVVKKELQAIREKYNDARRTQLVEGDESTALTATDLVADEKVWVMVGDKGTVGRTATAESVAVPAKPVEPPVALLEATTQDILYLFTADGRAASLPVHRLPQSQELGKGSHWVDLTGLTRNDRVVTALAVPTDAGGYLFLTTLGGVVKRVRLDDLPGITSAPFTVINVGSEDSLGWARLTTGQDEIILVTAMGQAIRFKEEDVRPMGLPAGGVWGIKLSGEADGVVAMDVGQDGALLWSITDNGMAKATPLRDYPVQGRYGQGVVNVKVPKEASEVVGAVVGPEERPFYILTALGSVKGSRIDKAAVGSRASKPQPLVTVGARNRIAGVIAPANRPSVNGGQRSQAGKGEDEKVAQQGQLL
jgi:DNA gyrase subunit A